MNERDYKRLTERELAGRKVKAVVTIANGNMSLPPGTVFTIKGKFSGLELTTEPCPCCGAKMFVTRVPPSFIELLPEVSHD